VTLLLNPRVLIVLALAALLSFSHFTAYRKGKATVRAEWAAEHVETERQAQAQAQRNRELQRAAETRYTVQAGVREEFIGYTITEIRHVAAPLASCAVPADAIRLFNRAAECARSDSPASCIPDKPVPVAR
jgi:hypothetical protein